MNLLTVQKLIHGDSWCWPMHSFPTHQPFAKCGTELRGLQDVVEVCSSQRNPAESTVPISVGSRFQID